MDILNIVLRIAVVLLVINVGKYISKKIEDKRWWKNKEKNKIKEEEYIKKQNRIQNGEFTIRAPGEYNIVGFIFMTVAVGFMIFLYFGHRYNMSVSPLGEDEFMGLMLCMSLFILIFIFGLILVLYKYVWHINFNSDEIEYRRFFGIKSHYKFSDITKCVEHYGMEYRLFVYINGKKKFSVDAMASGDALQFENFIKEKRIPTEKVQTKWYKKHNKRNR